MMDEGVLYVNICITTIPIALVLNICKNHLNEKWGGGVLRKIWEFRKVFSEIVFFISVDDDTTHWNIVIIFFIFQEPIPAATGEASEPQHIEDAYSGIYLVNYAFIIYFYFIDLCFPKLINFLLKNLNVAVLLANNIFLLQQE